MFQKPVEGSNQVAGVAERCGESHHTVGVGFDDAGIPRIDEFSEQWIRRQRGGGDAAFFPQWGEGSRWIQQEGIKIAPMQFGCIEVFEQIGGFRWRQCSG